MAAIAKDLLAAVLRRVCDAEEYLRLHPPVPMDQAGAELADALLCTPDDAPRAEAVFDRLRWGGQIVFVTSDRDEAVSFSTRLGACGFEIAHQPSPLVRGIFGLPLPIFARKVFYLVARKIELVRPGQTTDRFTYHVYLTRHADEEDYVVVKEVPTLETVKARLHAKWPELPEEILEKRARKFSDKIFPIFLTREAAILKIVNRDLPEEYRCRVPRLLEMQRDERGYARRLCLTWLRNGGRPLSQLEFARQSSDLLRALHDQAGVMHLDLRLDNFVITPRGVGFVDFGSAVRVDEDLKENPLLANLFEELMRTSEIQRMLASMTRTGQVTSEAISRGLHKVDKAVDCFYLAMQINSPHANPDLKDLIRYDSQGPQAAALSQLTQQILRPEDPAKPVFHSAADILRGIEQLEAAQAPLPPQAMPAGELAPARSSPRA